MFGVAILVMLLSACLAETAGYFDKNGGAMQYSKAAFGDFVGFNVGILGWAVTVIAWAAMLAGFAKIFIITFPAFEGYNLPISIGMLILLSLMNIAGLKTSKMFYSDSYCCKINSNCPLFTLCHLLHFRWREQGQLHTFPSIGKWNKPLQFYF